MFHSFKAVLENLAWLYLSCGYAVDKASLLKTFGACGNTNFPTLIYNFMHDRIGLFLWVTTQCQVIFIISGFQVQSNIILESLNLLTIKNKFFSWKINRKLILIYSWMLNNTKGYKTMHHL